MRTSCPNNVTCSDIAGPTSYVLLQNAFFLHSVQADCAVLSCSNLALEMSSGYLLPSLVTCSTWYAFDKHSFPERAAGSIVIELLRCHTAMLCWRWGCPPNARQQDQEEHPEATSVLIVHVLTVTTHAVILPWVCHQQQAGLEMQLSSLACSICLPDFK